MSKRILFISILSILIVFVICLYISVNTTDKTFSKTRLIDFDDKTLVDFKKYDSVQVAASDMYKANDVKRIFQGEQYRKAWSTPIKVPIVFLDTLKGGMVITKEGGGNQTHSLELKGSDSIIYTLRSVNKDAEPLIPEFLKTLGLENIVSDGISAQHPYAAILVAKLADKVNLLHTNPKVVFVPKQESLGKFNNKFGNRIFLLEYESEGDVNWTSYSNVTEIVDTEDLQELKQELKDSITIDEHLLVRNRLFDILIGDWDRHAKQWGWAIQKKNNVRVAIPIPCDRDNAFFNIEGLIPSILSNKNVVKELRPFSEDIDYMEGLIYPFDRYFLLKTNADVFINEAKYLQETLTDRVLEEALEVWPKNIRDLDGTEIIDKIKARRQNLQTYALEFHKIIQKQGVLVEALKGSGDLILSDGLKKCFECE